MAISVYVSTDPTVPFDELWELVGKIETRDATINERAAKLLHKHSSGSPTLRFQFYLAGDPAARWLQSVSERAPFAIAFDLLGDGSCVLTANRPAKVAPLETRTPEPHPGLRVRPVFVGIKITGGVKRV